jgi:phenylalanyl-tRNA synthetase beta chain
VIEAVLPEHLPRPQPIELRRARLARVLGTHVADAEVARILPRLAFRWKRPPTAGVSPAGAPLRLAIEEDLVEEIARIHGYDAIPTTLPGGATRLVSPSETRSSEHDARRQLVARDYLEAINYAFVDADLLATWQLADGGVALANPLSAELGVMRTRLLPGLVAALGRNAARQQSRMRLFEIGKTFAAVQRCADRDAPHRRGRRWRCRRRAMGRGRPQARFPRHQGRPRQPGRVVGRDAGIPGVDAAVRASGPFRGRLS